jgi:hypothetical protein
MVWGKAGSTTLSSAGDDVDITSLSESKSKMIISQMINSGACQNKMTFNDTGSGKYASRNEYNDDADSTQINQNFIPHWDGNDNASNPQFVVSFLCDVDGEAKIGMYFGMDRGTAGAGNTIRSRNMVYKYINTAKITRIDLNNQGAGSYDTGSNLTALGSDVTPAAAIPAIDNVQDNSLFVDKVNANRYWFDANPLVDDNFSSSSGWNQVTNTASGVVDGQLIGLTNSSGTNGAGAWKDYGLVDDEKFVLRCKFQIVTQSGGSGNASTLYFGISDTNGATSPHSNRDGFGIAITNYAASGMLWLYPDGTTWDSADTDLSLTPTQTTYYLEIARTSATSVTFKLFSDEYSTVVKTHTQTIASTLNDLRYIMFQEWRNSSGNTTKVAVDDLQIWNGVTTASGGGEWTREGALDKTGLKAYWRFNETSGNIINQAEAIGSTDSISSVDLTPYQSTHNVSKSPMNYSLQFDGTNDYAKAGTSTSAWNFMHSTTAKWTVCFWADMTGNSSGTIMGDAATNNTNNGIQMICTNVNGTFRARVTDGGGVVTQLITSSGFVPQDNTMHFYKITYDQSLSSDNMKMSVDNGTNVTQTKTANAPTDGNSQTELYIGSSDATNFFLAGEVAEMSIWSRVLTDAEVTAIYNSGSGVFPLF